jgi:hypothetical protein
MPASRHSSVQSLAALLLLGAAIGCQAPPDDDTPPAPGRFAVDPETGERVELMQGRPTAMPVGGGIESQTSSLVTEATDWSGKVHIQVFSCTTSALLQHQSIGCEVDPSYVLVGGGARTNYGNGPGALLTASYPVQDGRLRAWAAASKDHVEESTHYLTAYAVGLRIDGVARSTLAAAVQIKALTSARTAHPAMEVTTDEGYVMIGGGARTNYTGAGSLLYGSTPSLSTPDQRTWIGYAKDHKRSDPATITTWVIGIKPAIAGFGTLEVVTKQTMKRLVERQVGDVVVATDPGWVAAGAGAFSDGGVTGRLLTAIIPGMTYVEAQDKDHLVAVGGTLYAVVRQIRKKL